MISGPVGIRFPHVKGSDSLSFKDYLISSIIFANNIGAGPQGLSKKTFRIETQCKCGPIRPDSDKKSFLSKGQDFSLSIRNIAAVWQE